MVNQTEIGTLQRTFRAKTLSRWAQAVRPLGEGRWWVESQAKPGSGIGHVVTIGPGVFHCTCKDFERRFPDPCKHILAVAVVTGDLSPKPAPKPAPQPATQKPRVRVQEFDPTTGEVTRYAEARPTCRACGQQVPEVLDGRCPPCSLKWFYGDE